MDNTIFTVLKLLGSLALLMYGMKVMSEGLQKLTGDHLRNILDAMTTNRFTGLLTGAFVTAAVQSLIAAIALIVCFMSTRSLTSTQAIPVIMGAYIGTAVTARIMSFFGFQFNMTNIIFPLFALARYNIENEINNYRYSLKQHNTEDINSKEYQYQNGIYYMDISVRLKSRAIMY